MLSPREAIAFTVLQLSVAYLYISKLSTSDVNWLRSNELVRSYKL